VRRVVLPLAEWQELGGRRRRQVARAARRGHAHPDPYVAAVAQAWATEFLRVHGGRRPLRVRAGDAAWSVAITALVAMLLHGAVMDPGGSEWRERRTARRILAALPVARSDSPTAGHPPTVHLPGSPDG
jgi:hypothetical protein